MNLMRFEQTIECVWMRFFGPFERPVLCLAESYHQIMLKAGGFAILSNVIGRGTIAGAYL